MSSLDVLNLYRAHHGTLSLLLESRALKNGSKDCLISDQDRKWSWQAFFEWTAGLSQWLSTKNLVKGSSVAIIAGNSDLFVAFTFALADQGLVMVPINPELNESERNYILQHCEAKLILSEKKLRFEQTEVVVLDDAFLFKKSSRLSHKALASDLFLILYTSGTTGFPKGVMHPQKIAVMAGEAFVERMLLVPEDRLLCILPFFHINALFYSLMGSFAAGATLIVMRKFSATTFWTTAREFGATQVNIIAAVGNILAARSRSEFLADHKLKKVYGAPVSEHIAKVFNEEFKIPVVIEGYGMTEIPGAINNQIEGPWKVGTMGVAAKHPEAAVKFTELKIIDDNEYEVDPGDTGELVVRTPLLMTGYFKDPEQSKNSFTQDGWFKTGDLVKQDSEGFYVFVSRKKDIIRRRGENISGAEIDRIVSEHPAVLEAAAIGVASPLGEEDIYLAVVVKDDHALTEKEIHAWCEAKLSKVKCPQYIKIFVELPHTATSRVAKFKLKQDPTLMENSLKF